MDHDATKSISVWPVTDDFVAEIGDVDLSQALSPQQWDAIDRAFATYAVLIFPDQKLSGDDHVSFARRFGPLEDYSGYLKPGARSRLQANLTDVSNLRLDGSLWKEDSWQRSMQLANRLWHTDSTFNPIPARASLLYATTIAPIGGHTEFADMRAAYEALDDATRARIDGMVAEHSLATSRSRMGFTDFGKSDQSKLTPVPQVLVRHRTSAGRPNLYLASHAGRIVGLPDDAGRALIDALMAHATQRQFVYCHRWRANDLVMWDDRCTMHRGREFDDLRWPRDFRRATVSDEMPSCEREGVRLG